MGRFTARTFAIVCGSLLALVFALGPVGGVAHAEPGPRPTLTPAPPEPAPAPPEPAPAPPVKAPAAPADEAPAAPAPTPRPAIVVQLQPIAPVKPVEPQSAPDQPYLFGATQPVRYQPDTSAPAAERIGAQLSVTDLLSWRALLASVAAFLIVGATIMGRRRIVRL